MQNDKVYTVKQVAQALGFSTNTVYKYLAEGKITATRLGKEGRFRIPEEEVIRLLGLKGERVQIAPAFRSEDSKYPESQKISESELALLHKVSNPDLFDWFLCLTAIFLGVAYFLFPFSHQDIVLEPYRLWLMGLKIALIVFGILLIAIDLFVPAKKFYHHLFIHLPLTLILAGLTYIFYSTGNALTASYFGTLSLFAFLPIFWHKSAFLKFTAFVYVLIVASSIIFAQAPQPYFFADVRSFIHANPGLLEALLIIAATILAAMEVFSHYKSQQILILISWLVSGLFFLLSISFMSDQAWNKAIITLMIASFNLVFPFYREFDTLGRFTRKEVILSFSWLVCIVCVGLAIILYIQTTFRTFAFGEAQKRVATAANLVSDYMQDSIKDTNTIAQSSPLPVLLSGKAEGRALENFIKGEYQRSSTLKRIVLFDTKGNLLGLYPPGDSEPAAANVGDRHYFQEVLTEKRTVISELVASRVSAGIYSILIAAPVLDEEGEIVGVVAGGVDTASLKAKLSTIEFGQTGSFILADNKQTIFIHDDPSLVGKKAQRNLGLIAAVGGQRGQTEGYSEDGALSLAAYAPIPLLGWGIVSQQPIAETFRESSMLSFSMFLVTILSGTGALLVIVHRKHVSVQS